MLQLIWKKNYVNIHQSDFIPRLKEIGGDCKKIYFQQAGATAYTSHLNMEVLCNCSQELSVAEEKSHGLQDP